MKYTSVVQCQTKVFVKNFKIQNRPVSKIMRPKCDIGVDIFFRNCFLAYLCRADILDIKKTKNINNSYVLVVDVCNLVNK